QYEPYFSAEHRFDASETARGVGVTPLLYHDAANRLVRSEMPDGTLNRIDYSPWLVTTFDANDTVTQSQWYVDRGSPSASAAEPNDPDRRAAWLATQHANTPVRTVSDALGRDCAVLVHNRAPDANGTWQDERSATFTHFDNEGKPLWTRDALGRVALQFITPT